MNIGNQIANIRKEGQLTQEQFGELFHVTRQTVSNWEHEKSYPDLQTLVEISDRFGISLDTLLKEDQKMIETMDRERILGGFKREQSLIDFFTGAGTGILAGCLFAPDSPRRMLILLSGLLLLSIGWYKKAKHDRRILEYMENR